jgi:hypothetical protein
MIYNIENYPNMALEFSTDGVLKYSLQGYQNDWNGFYKTVTISSDSGSYITKSI